MWMCAKRVRVCCWDKPPKGLVRPTKKGYLLEGETPAGRRNSDFVKEELRSAVQAGVQLWSCK